MQVITFDKAPHTLLLHKSPFLQGTRPGTRGVTGFLSDTVGQTANEKRGAQDDSLEGEEDGGPEGTSPYASGERAAKKARVGDKSPLTTNAPLAGSNSILPPSLTGPSPNLTPQMAMQPNAVPRGPVYPPPMPQQMPTGHLSGFTATQPARVPPQPSFGGPHQIGTCGIIQPDKAELQLIIQPFCSSLEPQQSQRIRSHVSIFAGSAHAASETARSVSTRTWPSTDVHGSRIHLDDAAYPTNIQHTAPVRTFESGSS